MGTIDLKSDFDLYKGLNIIVTLLIFLGWVSSVSNSKSPIDYSNMDKT
jgi:hypothetical protein